MFGGDAPLHYLHVAPMFHLADLAGSIGALLLGGTHVMVPAFAPVPVMEAMEANAVTHTVLIPIMIQALADHPDLSGRDLTALRRVVYGGSPIAQAVLDRARKALPSAEFLQAYGQTELSPVATVLGAAEHEDAGRPHLLRTGGRAARRCEGRMHTGDVGRMDDEGYVEVLDRLKDMIIAGGENVYSTEVENAVAGHPAVANCAVVGLPDDVWGERVHAVVVLRDGAQVTVEEIREHVKASIAGYKASRTVEFVDALPATSTGKVLKRELRARSGGTG